MHEQKHYESHSCIYHNSSDGNSFYWRILCGEFGGVFPGTKTVSAPANIPQMIDSSGIPMIFKGWYTSEDFADGTGPYMPGETVPTNDKELSLYAKWEAPPVLKTGKELNLIFKSLSSGKNVTDYYNRDKTIKGIRKANDMPPGGTKIMEIQESGAPVYAWFDSSDGYICYFSSSDDIFMNKDSDRIFCYFEELVDLNGLAGWSAENVTGMYNMFYSCKSLADISGLESWDTKNVTNMSGMFRYCDNLSDLGGVLKWDTGNVSNMNLLFAGCKSLADISSLENWNTKNVTDMGEMFYYCQALTDISDLENWNTGNVTYMSYMFIGCELLTDASILENWNVGNVNQMVDMFPKTCKKVPSWYQ